MLAFHVLEDAFLVGEIRDVGRSIILWFFGLEVG